MNTLQQIAGALGTSLFVAIMSSNQKNYLMSINNPTDSKSQALSLVFGVHNAFVIQAFILILAVILSLFLKRNNFQTGKN
jgi:DHA2 family lincomycin resistance protein-like MFS transporter